MTFKALLPLGGCQYELIDQFPGCLQMQCTKTLIHRYTCLTELCFLTMLCRLEAAFQKLLPYGHVIPAREKGVSDARDVVGRVFQEHSHGCGGLLKIQVEQWLIILPHPIIV